VAIDTKARRIIQPKAPRAYSLIKRQVGSISGRRKCKAPNSKTKSTPDAMDSRAALAARADTGPVVISGLAISFPMRVALSMRRPDDGRTGEFLECASSQPARCSVRECGKAL